MKLGDVFLPFGPLTLADGLAVLTMLVGAGTASARGTRVSVSVRTGGPAFVNHHVHRPPVVHRPFVHHHFVRPIVVHPVVPKPIIVAPRAAVIPPTGVVFTPPPSVVVVPKWVWTGSRWE